MLREKSIRGDCWASEVGDGGTEVPLWLRWGLPRGPASVESGIGGTTRSDRTRMGLVSGTSQKPELRGQLVVVVKAAENWACHDLDRGILCRRA